MARFPVRESEIIALAQQMIVGYTAHPDIFINPPFPVTRLQALLADFLADRGEANLADASAIEAHTKNADSQEKLAVDMTTLLRHAENIVASPEQLGLIGGSARSAPAALQPPGQCRALEAVRQGSGWVFLDWKEPADGGKPAAYQVQRRELPGGDWTPVGTAVPSEATLVSQPTGKSLEYRVYALNKAGDGPVSNVVDVVL